MNEIAEWNERLVLCERKRRLKEKLMRRFAELEKENRELRSEVLELEDQLSKEKEDVERLRRASFTRLWNRLTGHLDDKLQIEIAESERVLLQHDAAAERASRLQADLESVRSELADVKGADAEYETIMKAKEAWVMRYDSDSSSRLQKLVEEAGRQEARLRDIQEAEIAGRQAADALDSAADRLHSARNWGAYDMIGGGLISTAVKHRRIEESRADMHTAQHAIRRFEKELSDVMQHRDWSGVGDIDGLLSFADYFFDGFLVDWMVQGRIREAQEHVDQGRDEVKRAQEELSRIRKVVDDDLTANREAYRVLLAGYVGTEGSR